METSSILVFFNFRISTLRKEEERSCFKVTRTLGTPIHHQKSLQSIVWHNSRKTGTTPAKEFRLRKKIKKNLLPLKIYTIIVIDLWNCTLKTLNKILILWLYSVPNDKLVYNSRSVNLPQMWGLLQIYSGHVTRAIYNSTVQGSMIYAFNSW